MAVQLRVVVGAMLTQHPWKLRLDNFRRILHQFHESLHHSEEADSTETAVDDKTAFMEVSNDTSTFIEASSTFTEASSTSMMVAAKIYTEVLHALVEAFTPPWKLSRS